MTSKLSDEVLALAMAVFDQPSAALPRLAAIRRRALREGRDDLARAALESQIVALSLLGRDNEMLKVTKRCALEYPSPLSWQYLARELHQRSRWGEAHHAYEEALRLMEGSRLDRRFSEINMARCDARLPVEHVPCPYPTSPRSGVQIAIDVAAYCYELGWTEWAQAAILRAKMQFPGDAAVAAMLAFLDRVT